MMKAMSSPRGSMFASFSSPKRVTFAATTSSSVAQLVAGMDISLWETVEIADVQPGPLGIFLDDQSPEAAVLDHFGPTPDGVKGAVELDGRVPVGSVLVAVNEFDLLEQKLSLQEVARVLRETSHLVRSLSFKVPPTRCLDAIEVSAVESAASPTSSVVGEIEERVLIKGMDNSSFKEKKSKGGAGGDKRSWNFMSLLSPTQIAGGVAAMSGFDASPSSSTPVAPEFPVTDEPASTPTSPSATTTVREASLTLSSRSLYDSNKVAAKIPPGPIGLNLDGSIPDRAVVLGFLPLPDGSAGVLERRGDIPPGSVLVAINGSSVTHLSLEDIRTRLGALASFDRELVFELPAPDDGAPRVLTAKNRAAAFNRLGDLDKRRKIELGLVLKHDSSRIKRHECWFLIDAQWMARWIEFTSKGGVNPGPITNHVLLEHDWEARVSGLAAGRPDAPRAGLELMKDYRCVTPMVWALFAELHGTNNVPVQARYVLDAYAEPLAETDVTPILAEPQLKATAIVNEMRDRYQGAFAD